ncbi:5-formyltetrahydrofolate cyclo-ligase [Leucothrix sargassi]|nr:5-formyltetrahydrofolate cyclo-ligase [Leucothrix sargassi]
MQDQSTIRKTLQKRRQALSASEQQALSMQICEQLLASNMLDYMEHIAIYLPVRGEADPTPLLNSKLSNKQFYLPVLSQEKAGYLTFAAYSKDTVMTVNKFKIPEPDLSQTNVINSTALDCVIMPAVGIDTNGNRIGMGGGFYDRTFAYRKQKAHKPMLVGFCYEFQLIDPQTPQAWDIPADAVVTDKRFKRFKRF